MGPWLRRGRGRGRGKGRSKGSRVWSPRRNGLDSNEAHWSSQTSSSDSSSSSSEEEEEEDHTSNNINVDPEPEPSLHQRLTDYAESYISAVKAIFDLQDEGNNFDEFLDLLINFREDRFGITEFFERVRILLKSHPVLILGFNTFLPKRFHITYPKKPVELTDAHKFARKVKERFRNYDEGRYESFIRILNKYRSESSDKEALRYDYKLLLAVFRDDYDLLDEFGNFLPGYANV